VETVGLRILHRTTVEGDSAPRKHEHPVLASLHVAEEERAAQADALRTQLEYNTLQQRFKQEQKEASESGRVPAHERWVWFHDEANKAKVSLLRLKSPFLSAAVYD
jgi:hypothetical protein